MDQAISEIPNSIVQTEYALRQPLSQMELIPLILIGGGGHCRSCIDVIETTGLYHIRGVLDMPEKAGEDILGYKVVGSDDDIARYAAEGCTFFITLGHIKSALGRKKIFDALLRTGAPIATIISPNAYVSRHATIGAGSIVMNGAVVNAASTIGANCIINSKALIEHDCRVGDHVHVSTAAVLNGECSVGDGSFIGSNAVLKQRTGIGENVLIGAGSVVLRDAGDGTVIKGNPAR